MKIIIIIIHYFGKNVSKGTLCTVQPLLSVVCIDAIQSWPLLPKLIVRETARMAVVKQATESSSCLLFACLSADLLLFIQ